MTPTPRRAPTAAVLLLLLLGGGGAVEAQDPAVVNADLIEVHIDNDNVRVFAATLAPGTREAPHSHPATVIHVLAGGGVRNHAGDGTVTESEMPTGATVYREPMTHWVENIGTTTIRVLVVELKASPGAGGEG